MAHAQEEHKTWGEVDLDERRSRVTAAVDAMAQHRDLLAMLLVWEIGKPWRLACADVDRGLDGVRWYVNEIERQLAAKTPDEYGILLLDLLGVKGIVPESLDAVILSSVVPPLTATFEELAEKYLHRVPLTVSSELKTGLTLRYENPAEIGTDRIVNAAAAFLGAAAQELGEVRQDPLVDDQA